MDLEKASEYICHEISNTKSGWAAGKIGTSELNAIRWFLDRSYKTKTPYPEGIIKEMTKNAGFWCYPGKTMDESLDMWAETTLAALSCFDALVAWSPSAPKTELKLLNHYSPNSKKIVLRALEPYYMPAKQYTLLMTDGPIAVISPFAKSIAKQWLMRSEIFPKGGLAGSMWLPEQTLIPINSAYGPHMTDSNLSWSRTILNLGPEAAIMNLVQQTISSGARYAFVGIGSLSLLLVSRLKANGIIAIHTGGGTQIMFGIKGKRWSNHSVISKLFNPNWIHPGQEEVPTGAKNVEDGCYW